MPMFSPVKGADSASPTERKVVHRFAKYEEDSFVEEL